MHPCFYSSDYDNAVRKIKNGLRQTFQCSFLLFNYEFFISNSSVSLSEYTLLALSSLFVIVDPIAIIPVFLAMTPNDTPEQRIRTAKIACLTMAAVLVAFAFAGTTIFKVFGISMPAFQIAASIVLLIIALDMLRVQRSRVQETHEEKQAGTAKTDIAITPLAIPMLAGPGAISTTILLQNEAKTIPEHVAMYSCILLVALVSYLIFRLAVRGARWLNPIIMSIAVRIMGLLLAAIAIQFMLNGIKEFHSELLSPPVP